MIVAIVLVGIAVSVWITQWGPLANTKYVSPYDIKGIELQDGRAAYFENGQQQSRLGIDVSENQGYIDWNAVATDGIEFAFIRLGRRGYTEGGLEEDDYVHENLVGAQQAGLLRGGYFYSQAVTEEEARAEAQFVLQVLGGEQLELPIAYDYERTAGKQRADTLSSEQISRNAEAFMTVLEQAGYRTTIYGNRRDLSYIETKLRENKPIWFAEYNAAFPSLQADFTVWQYSNSGSVAGIDTAVDMDLWFLTAPVALD